QPACSRIQRNQHSFPTRRSSDLQAGKVEHEVIPSVSFERKSELVPNGAAPGPRIARLTRDEAGVARAEGQEVEVFLVERVAHPRSEEHTSELQSREKLVCRLLLE